MWCWGQRQYLKPLPIGLLRPVVCYRRPAYTDPSAPRTVIEAVAAAVITALLSMGSGAALSAARKAGETRDSVLVLDTRMTNIEGLLQRHLADSQLLSTRVDRIDHILTKMDSRVSALENCVVDRRATP